MFSKNITLDRINADILKIISSAVYTKMNDERLFGINILRVETSADLSTARVYVNDGTDILSRAAKFLRGEIAKNMNLRRVPNLNFFVDKGIENSKIVEELLRKC